MSHSFQETQKQFALHIRDPEHVARLPDVESRRMKIYNDLFFNNIESFIAGAFPIFKSLFEQEQWLALIREFFVEHRCQTPYFLEISQEFLTFLNQYSGVCCLPGFSVELTHYEWVELALDVADIEPDWAAIEPNGDLLDHTVAVSPVAWPLCYSYPVHLIGKDFQPDKPSDSAHYMLVYRDRTYTVKFMQINAVTARLLELLNDPEDYTGKQAISILGKEIGFSNEAELLTFGLQILTKLQNDGIILGVMS